MRFEETDWVKKGRIREALLKYCGGTRWRWWNCGGRSAEKCNSTDCYGMLSKERLRDCCQVAPSVKTLAKTFQRAIISLPAVPALGNSSASASEGLMIPRAVRVSLVPSSFGYNLDMAGRGCGRVHQPRVRPTLGSALGSGSDQRNTLRAVYFLYARLRGVTYFVGGSSRSV